MCEVFKEKMSSCSRGKTEEEMDSLQNRVPIGILEQMYRNEEFGYDEEAPSMCGCTMPDVHITEHESCNRTNSHKGFCYCITCGEKWRREENE